MSEQTKTKSEKILEVDESINAYYGIEESKVFDITTEQKSKIESVLKQQLKRAVDDFHTHLRGRIIDLIDSSEWESFGLKPNPGGKPNPIFDPAAYHKDIKGYEKRYEARVEGFVAIDLGEELGNSINGDKIAIRKASIDTIKKDKAKILKINMWAKKYGILLKPYKG